MNPKLPQSRRARRAALGAELRRLRQLAGLSGRSLANRLGIKQERLSRIESGGTPASLPLVLAWADAVSASDDDTGRLRWMTEQAVTEIIPLEPWIADGGVAGVQDDIARVERGARQIFNFQPGFVPGLLQTAEYARRVIATFAAADQVEAAVAKRLERHQILYDTTRSFEFLLTDAALRWHAGPGDILVPQLDQIVSIATLRNVTVRVIPRDAVWHAAPTCGFVLYGDSGDEDKPMAAIEAPDRRVTSDDVQAYRREFDLLRRSALTEAASVDYIRELAANL